MKPYTKTIRTKRGAVRRYNAIINWIYKQGGATYGIDMPTTAIRFPELYKDICWIKNNYKELPA